MSRPGHVFDVMARLQTPGCSRQARAYGWEGASARIAIPPRHTGDIRRATERDNLLRNLDLDACKARNFPSIAQGTPQSSSIEVTGAGDFWDRRSRERALRPPEENA